MANAYLDNGQQGRLGREREREGVLTLCVVTELRFFLRLLLLLLARQLCKCFYYRQWQLWSEFCFALSLCLLGQLPSLPEILACSALLVVPVDVGTFCLGSALSRSLIVIEVCN